MGAGAETTDTSSRNYEFDHLENKTISELSRSMSLVGLIHIVAGGLVALYSSPLVHNDHPAHPWEVASVFLVAAVLLIVKGVQLRLAGSYFNSVVTTQGSDITNLMDALEDVKGLYDAQWWFATIAALVFLGAAISALR